MFGQMEGSMSEIGKIVKWTEWEYLLGWMAKSKNKHFYKSKIFKYFY